MKIIKFELFKLSKNKAFKGMFILVCLILFLFFVINQNFIKNDFVTEQKDRAESMVNSLNIVIKKNSNPLLMVEKDYYNEIIDATTWQEMYLILNEIDTLLLENSGLILPFQEDIQFDYSTNIKLRNYNLDNDISPNDNSMGIAVHDLFYYIYDFLCPIIILIVGALIMIEEYENQTIKYLYTIHFSYPHIIISKWVSILISSIILILIPLLIFGTVLFFSAGLTNSKTLFHVAPAFGNYFINDLSFLTINNYIIHLFFILILNVFLTSSVIVCFTIIFKKKKIILSCCGILILIGVYMNFIVPTGRTLLAHLSLINLCMMTLLIVVATYSISIYFLKKRDAL